MSIKPPFANPLDEAALAIDAAIQASKAVMEIYAQDFAIERKDDDSPITKADLPSREATSETV